MIAIASENNELPERTPNELDIEHSKGDIAMVRSLARHGLLSADSIHAISKRLEDVAMHGEEERMRVAADKALAVMQISLMKLLVDKPEGSGAGSTVTNQQINIYMPANGRETDQLTNGHNGNGRH